jgi:hypothetical protein
VQRSWESAIRIWSVTGSSLDLVGVLPVHMSQQFSSRHLARVCQRLQGTSHSRWGNRAQTVGIQVPRDGIYDC